MTSLGESHYNFSKQVKSNPHNIRIYKNKYEDKMLKRTKTNSRSISKEKFSDIEDDE